MPGNASVFVDQAPPKAEGEAESDCRYRDNVCALGVAKYAFAT
jgi:hypothetical protein